MTIETTSAFPTERKIRPDAINCLRVLAALMVFLFHTSLFMNDPGELNDHGVWTILVRPSAWAGVWIFFLLSGYLCGRGFLTGRYPLTWRGVGAFYLRRIRKVWFPTLCFILLCLVLIYPTYLSENPGLIWKFLLCTYRGIPGVNGIGATWFIFTLMWLYFVSPLVALGVKALARKPGLLTAAFFALVLLGCGYRFLADRMGWDWAQHVYGSPYGNFDLFACGMLLNAIVAQSKARQVQPGTLVKCLGLLAVAFVFLFGGYCNYTTLPVFSGLHTRVLPSLTILGCGLFLYCFDRESGWLPAVPEKSFFGLCCRCVNGLSGLAFAFYLFHSVVLYAISQNIVSGGGAKEYFTLLFFAAVLTLIMSYGWNRIFLTKKSGPGVTA